METVTKLIFNALSDFEYYDINIEFEDDDLIVIEVISDEFIDIRLTVRIDMLYYKIAAIQRNELSHFHLQLVSITVNEKYLGISETGVKNVKN